MEVIQGTLLSMVNRDCSDLFDGNGVYCKSDKTIYDGEWVQGQQCGIARVKYANNDYYVGDYKYGKRHGRGQYTFSNGEVYSGEFINDMMYGLGTLIKDGNIIKTGINSSIKQNRKMGRTQIHGQYSIILRYIK